ncbi:MAG TPA: hypothetical protein VMZ91_05150 [Candidatus Paceibacterota bacterium]|nr:hypothetical protein [Candidatus Paceibacterota bacterium]
MKKTSEEFDLSEKIDGYDPITQIVVRGDVKEFIKRYEEKLRKMEIVSVEVAIFELRQLAGEDLK